MEFRKGDVLLGLLEVIDEETSLLGEQKIRVKIHNTNKTCVLENNELKKLTLRSRLDNAL